MVKQPPAVMQVLNTIEMMLRMTVAFLWPQN